MLDPLNAFWAGILLCYVQQPMLASDIFISWHNEDIFVKTLFATLTGLVFVVLSYEMNWGGSIARIIPQPPARLNSEKLLIAAWSIIALGLAGYSYIINLSGGLDQWLSVGRGGTDYDKVQGYWPMLIDALPAGVFLLLFRSSAHRVSRLGSVLAYIAVALMWWWFLYLGTRSRIINLTILVLAALYLPKRRNPNFALALGIFVALQVIVDFQAAYRGNFTGLSFNMGSIDKGEMWRTILPGVLGGDRQDKRAQVSQGAEFNCAMAVMELVPQKVPYNYGYGFLELLTRPIPRAIWPNKRYPHLESVQGVLFEGHLSDSINPNVRNEELLMGPSFGFVGHWYYVGGFVGLVLGALMTGTLLRMIREFYNVGERGEGTMITYPFLVSIGFLEASATPLYWVYNLPFVLLPFFVMFYFCREEGIQARLRATSR